MGDASTSDLPKNARHHVRSHSFTLSLLHPPSTHLVDALCPLRNCHPRAKQSFNIVFLIFLLHLFLALVSTARAPTLQRVALGSSQPPEFSASSTPEQALVRGLGNKEPVHNVLQLERLSRR
jgi:hypothetical protein